MNGTDLSRHLGHLPDEMLEEAMAPSNAFRKKHTTSRVLRVAAIAAVLAILLTALSFWPAREEGYITGPGLLVVRAHAADMSSSTELAKDVVLPYNYYWSFTNWAPGLPITLSVSDSKYDVDNIHFQITVDGGGCYVGKFGDTSIYPGLAAKPIGTEFTIPNNTTVFWDQFWGSAEGNVFWKEGTVAFLNIIILHGEEIIGYAILRFDRASTNGLGFIVSMVDSVSFLSSEGITEEYVNTLVEEVKAVS